MYSECDFEAHVLDSVRNGDFELNKQFIKVGKRIINLDQIAMVNYAEAIGYVWIVGQDEPCKFTGEKLTALVEYLSNSERCVDVLAPEPEIDTPMILEDASGIRIEV